MMVHNSKSKANNTKFWTDSFPQLNLHSAAATGNVGLVKYALANGQPQNSSLHGVLPIHAACSNGNESIVRMLLENGADVNAPRLPRRYSNEKRSHNALSVGTSGSTPLHFAAANGHAGIVELLLSCGARPDLTEKRGLTPEDVAREHGHTEVVKILQNWDRSGAALALPVSDIAARRYSLDSRDLPPPDLHASTSGRHSFEHPSLAKKHSSPSLRSSRKFSSSISLHSHRSPTMEPVTYSALTLLPNTSSNSLTDSRRLPSVLEKAAHPGHAIKQALGLPSSTSSASLSRPPPLTLTSSTQDSFSKPPLHRKGSTSSTRSALKAVFGRKRRSSSSGSASPFSPSDSLALTPVDTLQSGTTTDDGETPLHSPSSDGTTEQRAASPASGQTTLPSIDLPPSLPSPQHDSHFHPQNYRPRKSSILSSREAITAQNSPEIGQQEESSPALSGASSFEPPHSPEEENEAEDQFPGIDSHYRSSSASRLRANSGASVSSTGSRYNNLSPHVMNHSSLGSVSGDSSQAPSLLEIGTRARRSASTSTEPDLRHLVLDNRRDGSQTDPPTSPMSSSWSQTSLNYGPSTASTPPTSLNYSHSSPRDPPQARKFSSGEVITPSMADDMVKQAEKRLLSYSSNRSSQTLSEQLAAYSDTLKLQREVNRSQKGRPSYTWEKLERDGGRTPIQISEGQPRGGGHHSKTPSSSAFQQGVLDNRREPPPKLRQEAAKTLRESKSHSSLSTTARSIENARPPVVHQKTITPALQYRILESNHLNVPASSSSGRRSPTSTIDDPVRRSSASASSTSSSSSIHETPRPAKSVIRRTSVPPLEPIITPELITPTASRNAPEPPFGIASLQSSESRGKTRLAKRFDALKSRLRVD